MASERMARARSSGRRCWSSTTHPTPPPATEAWRATARHARAPARSASRRTMPAAEARRSLPLRRSSRRRVVLSEVQQLFGRFGILAQQIQSVVDEIRNLQSLYRIWLDMMRYGRMEYWGIRRAKRDNLSLGTCEIPPFKASQLLLMIWQSK